MWADSIQFTTLKLKRGPQIKSLEISLSLTHLPFQTAHKENPLTHLLILVSPLHSGPVPFSNYTRIQFIKNVNENLSISKNNA